MRNSTAFRLALAGLIAGLYAALTWAIAPYAFGTLQIRIAEAMTALPALFPEAIPGLTVGCMLANLVSPLGIMDIIVGTLATFIAALLSYLLRGIKYRGIPVLAPLPPIIVNAIMIGGMLAFFSKDGFALAGFAISAAQVGLGQAVSCYGLGLPLLTILQKRIRNRTNL